MLQLTSLGVRNLRSLRDTGVIPIKPLTILVGKNSAGKSSFARILPLLRQSAERRKQAPILWYGRLVDFGSFGDAVSSFAEQREIVFTFEFSADDPLFLTSRFEPSLEIEGVRSTGTVTLQITLVASGDDDRTILRRLALNVFGTQVILSAENIRSPQLFIDGTEVRIPSEASLVTLSGALVPQIRLIYRASSGAASVSDAAYLRQRADSRLGAQEARDAISRFVHGNTLTERKDDLAERLPLASPSSLLQHCRNMKGTSETWRHSFEEIADPTQSYRLQALRKALVLYKLEALLSHLDDALEAFSMGVSYLEPLRATAQRYYRREEVSIEELDPKGLNTAFFIQGLASRERESLNEWLRTTFQFSLAVKNAGGHTSLHIETGIGAQSRNIADVGLGYSQLAPVAIQLWAARRYTRRPGSGFRTTHRPRSRFSPATVVIEQPELHLHPAFQAKLADVFAACTSSSIMETRDSQAPPIRILAETHSPNLINRLGELINGNALNPDDVQVIVFELEEEAGTATRLQTARFDKDGILRNWPVGFFDY